MTASERELMAEVARGDEAAVAALLAAHWDTAYRVALRFTRDPGGAEDVAQEAFVQALAHAERFDSQRAVKPWLMRIVENRARNWLRAKRRRAAHEARASQQDPAMEQTERQELVAKHLAKLADPQQEVLTLHYWSGLTFAEIAAELGCPLGTVASRVRRGLERLRQSLAPQVGLTAAALVVLLETPPAQAASPVAPIPAELLERAQAWSDPGLASQAASAPAPAPSVGSSLAGPLPVLGAVLGGLALTVGFGGALGLFAADAATPAAQQVAGLPAAPLPNPPAPPPPTPEPEPEPKPEVPRPELPPQGRPEQEPPAVDPVPPVPPVPVKAPGQAKRGWVLGQSQRVDSVELSPQARMGLQVLPVELVWLNGAPTLVGIENFKQSNPQLVLWQQKGQTWERTATQAGINFPRVVDLGADGLGLIASVGEDTRGGYGNALRFYRFDVKGQLVTDQQLIPGPAQGRVTPAGLWSLGKGQVLAAAFSEEGQQRTLIYQRSGDRGQSWETVSEQKTSMSEDTNSAIGALSWTDGAVGRFAHERQDGLWLTSSADGGRSWTKRPVQLVDSLNARMRLPLGSCQLTREDGLVYLAGGQSGQGRYCFTWTLDRGKTWAPGVPITPEVKLEDPSAFVQIAAAGRSVVFAYPLIEGQWTAGEFSMRLCVSGDAGATWQELELGDAKGGIFGVLAADPQGGFVYATAVPNKDEGTSELWVTRLRHHGK